MEKRTKLGKPTNHLEKLSCHEWKGIMAFENCRVMCLVYDYCYHLIINTTT